MNIAANLGANTTGTAPLTSLVIIGGGTSANTDNLDTTRGTLVVNDGSDFARALNFAYQDNSRGDLNIEPSMVGSGLGGAASNVSVVVQTIQTLIENALPFLDTDTITGVTGADDQLTVAELPTTTGENSAFLPNGTVAGSSVTAFLDGQPYLNAPPPELTNINPGDHNLPGISGHGSGPDLLINGISGALTLNGGGNSGTPGLGDQAIVYAASEGDLVDTNPNAADIFGLGAGVLQAGFGVGNAYDTIGTAANPVTDAGATFSNNRFGALVDIALDTPSFVQAGPAFAAQQPGFIIDGGDEGVAQPSGISDTFTVAPSANFNIHVNGNLPLPTNDPNTGVPQGDQLNVTFPGSINVFSDSQTPPNVTVTGQTNNGDNPFGVQFSSMERVNLNPGNGVVNIIGDDDVSGNDQNDYFKVRGGIDPLGTVGVPGPHNGVGQFSLQIGGSWHPADGSVGNPDPGDNTLSDGLSSPIYFFGVTRINASGGAANGFDFNGNAIPDTIDPAGVNALDITPYADNTPLGWGIETYWNQGNPFIPDGGEPNPDLLIFNGVSGVSENITVQPSAYQAGQVFDNNAATHTPIAVVNYVNNTNIIVNGSSPAGTAGDTDNLYLMGTDPASDPDLGAPSGNDNFDVNLERADVAGLPGVTGNELVRVTDFNNGTSLYNIQNFTNFGTININTLGGSDTTEIVGRDDGTVSLNVTGSDSVLDTVNFLGVADAADFFEVGPSTNGGVTVLAQRSTALFFTQVNLTNIGTIGFDGGGGTGDDFFAVFGTTGGDQFTVSPTDALDGSITAAGFPFMNYSNLGSGSGGSFSTVEIVGNIFGGSDNDGVRFIGPGAVADYTYIPDSSTSGELDMTTGGDSVDFLVFGVSSLSLDAQEPPATPGDTLAVDVTNAIITPGSASGTGTVSALNAGGQSLLPLSFVNVESTTITGGTVVIDGTAGDDVISVSGTGIVTVADPNGIVTSTYDLSGANALVINALAGNDTINIVPSALFAGGISVLGGEPGAGSDTLNINTTAALPNATVDFGSNEVTGVVGGPISLSSIEDLVLNGLSGVLNAFTVLGYGGLTDVTSLILNGGDTTGDDGDKISITTVTTVESSLNFTPLSDSDAVITRDQGGPTISVTDFNNGDGNLTLANGSGRSSSVDFIGSPGNDAIDAIQTAAGDTRLTDFAGIAGLKRMPVDLVSAVGDGWQSVEVDGGLGNDTLTVDNSNGLVDEAYGIYFDGGPGQNSLILTGSTTVASDTYTPGPGTGQGTDIQSAGRVTQIVSFANLAPVFDSVAGPLVVNGTNADNAINYTEGNDTTNTHNPAWGQVSVDNFEAINFTNKTTLVINAGAGDDVVNLHNSNDDVTGLTSITVNGGAPTAGPNDDILIVNAATAGGAIDYIQSAAAGAATVTGAGPVTINTTGMQAVYVNGTAANVALTVTTLAGFDQDTLTPGTAIDSGTVTITSTRSGQATVPTLYYLGLGAGGSVTFADASGTAADTLIYNGTAGSDIFSVAATTGAVTLNSQLVVHTPGIANLVLDGNSGMDLFNVAARSPIPASLWKATMWPTATLPT